jgi:hypothetical protein
MDPYAQVTRPIGHRLRLQYVQGCVVPGKTPENRGNRDFSTDLGGEKLIGKGPLLFVRCTGILLQRGNAICVAFPPPSLGVSSLDLGRLHPRAAFFLALLAERSGKASMVQRGRYYSAAAR